MSRFRIALCLTFLVVACEVLPSCCEGPPPTDIAQCAPCKPVTQQNAGCIYKTCLMALYQCTEASVTGSNGTFASAGGGTVMNQDGGDSGTSLSNVDNNATGAWNGNGTGTWVCYTPTADVVNNHKDRLNQIMSVFSGAGSPMCWVDITSAFDAEISSPKGGAITPQYLAAHDLMAVPLGTAVKACRAIAGISATDPDDATGDSAQTSINVGAMNPAMVAALSGALINLAQQAQAQQQAQGNQGFSSTGDCQSNQPPPTAQTTGSSVAPSAQSDLADARGLFGGGAIGPSGSGGIAGSGGPSGGGFAGTAVQGSAPAGNSAGPNLAAGSAGAAGTSPTSNGGAASTGTAAGVGGGGDGFGSGAGQVAGGGGGDSGDTGASGSVGAATAFDSVSAGGGGGGRGKSGSPLDGLLGGGAAGGGVNGVSLGGGGGDISAGGATADKDGIINDPKVSLFQIVNIRTDKYSKDMNF